MSLKLRDFYLYGIISVMFFWDILERNMNNLSFIVLGLVFLIFVTFQKTINISKKLFLIICFLVIHGFINIAFGNNTILLFSTQLISIFFCVIVYWNISILYNSHKIFYVYWISACIMAYIGILEEIISILNLESLSKLPIVFSFTNYYYRSFSFVKLASLCNEPSFLGYYLAPAVCLILFYIIDRNKIPCELANKMNKISIAVVFIAYLGTFSMTSYAGLTVMLIFVWYTKGVSLKKICFFIGAIIFGIFLYLNNPDINVRVNDTIAIFMTDKVSDSNLTTYTYYSNFNVTKNGLFSSSFMGTGLGSYQVVFDRYNIGSWGNSGIILNREDGNSMFFRILTELGIAGVIMVGFFLIHYFVGRKFYLSCYSCALMPLFVMLLIRQGNYTHGGVILFVCLYYKVYSEQKSINRECALEALNKQREVCQ